MYKPVSNENPLLSVLLLAYGYAGGASASEYLKVWIDLLVANSLFFVNTLAFLDGGMALKPTSDNCWADCVTVLCE